jgi:anaerobic ribonucleoside-triphosphate reductase activating protein
MAYFMDRSKANGHGERAVVWVQGCNLKCSGCFNPQNWSFEPNIMVPVTELANKILMIESIEGVTFSGGEPFLQADALADLAEILQQNGKTVLIFTGFTYTELKDKEDIGVNRLLAAADMLVSGRYDQENATDGKALIASSNQKVISLTGKIPAPDAGEIPPIEINIHNGEIYITGFPDIEYIRKLKAHLGG